MPDYLAVAILMSVVGIGIAVAGIIVDTLTTIKLKQYGMTREDLEDDYNE